MLGLTTPTSPSWILAANANLPALLIDHAHCEKKAASNAIALINRYPYHQRLVTALLSLAQEELQHFNQVHALLLSRDITFTYDHGDEYAKSLHTHVRKAEPQRLLDSLLVAGLIEARSCERFTILSKECADPELKSMYAELLASEAGHYSLFTELAREYCGIDPTKERFEELIKIEGALVSSLSHRPAMHG